MLFKEDLPKPVGLLAVRDEHNNPIALVYELDGVPVIRCVCGVFEIPSRYDAVQEGVMNSGSE